MSGDGMSEEALAALSWTGLGVLGEATVGVLSWDAPTAIGIAFGWAFGLVVLALFRWAAGAP